MNKKSRLVAALCAVVFGLATAGAAFAGEVTGNGDNTPIGAAPDNDLHAHSICSFSGLNDEYYRDGDTSAPRTQHPAPGDLHSSPNACQG
jgi:hypothetical protein